MGSAEAALRVQIGGGLLSIFASSTECPPRILSAKTRGSMPIPSTALPDPPPARLPSRRVSQPRHY